MKGTLVWFSSETMGPVGAIIGESLVNDATSVVCVHPRLEHTKITQRCNPIEVGVWMCSDCWSIRDFDEDAA